jgi:hypothetical protein
MPRKRTQKIYFGEEQEKAVVMYLESTDDAEKNKIFNEEKIWNFLTYILILCHF